MTSNTEQRGEILMAWKAIQIKQILKGQFNGTACVIFLIHLSTLG